MWQDEIGGFYHKSKVYREGLVLAELVSILGRGNWLLAYWKTASHSLK